MKKYFFLSLAAAFLVAIPLSVNANEHDAQPYTQQDCEANNGTWNAEGGTCSFSYDADTTDPPVGLPAEPPPGGWGASSCPSGQFLGSDGQCYDEDTGQPTGSPGRAADRVGGGTSSTPSCPSGQTLGVDGQCYDNADGRGTGIYPFGRTGTGGGGTGNSINTGYLQYYKDTIVLVINSMLLPLVIALAFIVFIWGVFKKYIFSRGDSTAVGEGHQLILWGIIGFVVIFSIWGLVNLVRDTVGLGSRSSTPPVPTINVGGGGGAAR